MQVTTDYLEDFAVKSISDYTEVKLHGWEMDGQASITLDDPKGHALSYVHWDEWPENKSWKIKGGTDKRWTFVVVTKDGEIVGDHAYEFAGLVEPLMLREWFRAHLGFNEAPPGTR